MSTRRTDAGASGNFNWFSLRGLRLPKSAYGEPSRHACRDAVFSVGRAMRRFSCRAVQWIDGSIERADQRRIERYFAQSADMTELDTRMREFTYRHQ